MSVKTLVQEHIRKCVFQLKLDNLLALLSFSLIMLVVSWLYSDDRTTILTLALISVGVHSVVAIYCHRVWKARIRKWEEIERRWYLIVRTVEELLTLSDNSRPSLTEWVEGVLESRLSAPILS